MHTSANPEQEERPSPLNYQTLRLFYCRNKPHLCLKFDAAMTIYSNIQTIFQHSPVRSDRVTPYNYGVTGSCITLLQLTIPRYQLQVNLGINSYASYFRDNITSRYELFRALYQQFHLGYLHRKQSGILQNTKNPSFKPNRLTCLTNP